MHHWRIQGEPLTIARSETMILNTTIQCLQLILRGIHAQREKIILLQITLSLRIPSQHSSRQPTVHLPIEKRLVRIRVIDRIVRPINLIVILNHKARVDADPITDCLGDMQYVIQHQRIRPLIMRCPNHLQPHRADAQHARRTNLARCATVCAEGRTVLGVVVRAADHHPVPATLVGGVALGVLLVVVAVVVDCALLAMVFLASGCSGCLGAFVVLDVAVVVTDFTHFGGNSEGNRRVDVARKITKCELPR